MGLDHNLDTAVFSLETATPTAPGAGVQLSWPCPDRARVQILSVHFSTAVANSGSDRLSVVAGYDGSDNFAHSALADLLSINGTRWSYFALNVDARDHETTHDVLSGELSGGLILDAGDSLVTLIDALAGADEIDNVVIRYRQWIMSQ